MVTKTRPFSMRMDRELIAALGRASAAERRSRTGQVEWYLRQMLERDGYLPALAAQEGR